MAAIIGTVGALTGAFGTHVANAAGTALGYHSVTNSKIAPDAVSKSKIRNESVGAGEIVEGSVTWGNLAQSTKDKISALSAAGATSFQIKSDGHLYATMADGTEKDLGKVVGQDAPQPVAVTAQTAITNRPDGGHGTASWATDNMTRTLAIQRHGQVDVSHCGSTEADACWFYTATIADVGTFTTTDGATSPNAGAPINGTVTGTINGVGEYEFYSTDATPNANLVPATEDDSGGVVNGSSTWPKLAFKDGSVHGLTEHKYSYTYAAQSTCEQWVDASNNNDGTDDSAGDITGTNACQ